MSNSAAATMQTDSPWRPRLHAGLVGAALLVVIVLPCFMTLPWSMPRYDQQNRGSVDTASKRPPSWIEPMGTDSLERSLLWRVLLGGAISLGIGISAALIAVGIGVAWGAVAGYAGGQIDAVLMRIVDVLYGLPYILLVVMLDLALQPAISAAAATMLAADLAEAVADMVTLLLAIGGVSWLTMARVVRGQVLSLRGQPFIEAARAYGTKPARVLWVHVLPNLAGVIVVYMTLTVPQAILQESFLSFLGIGIQAPLPSWGNLATEGIDELHLWASPPYEFRWWLPFFPCLLLGLTLMSLNFLGDALRERFDPKSTGHG